MQKQFELNEENENAPKDIKGFPGMENGEDLHNDGRTSEEVREARVANVDLKGGTHGGSKSPEGKINHDKGGSEGNTGTHPF